MELDGIRLSDQLETWCRLAEVLPVEDLVVMGDGLLARKRPVTALGAVQAAVAQRSSQRGIARLRQALALIRENTDSAQETRLRLSLWHGGLPDPLVNAPIRNRYGTVIAHGDLVYPQQRVVVEYDGTQHWQDSRQFSIDIERLDELAEERWRIIRVDKHLLARPASLHARVRTALTRNVERS